jgi:membrane-bound serine protease (ClpP class)
MELYLVIAFTLAALGLAALGGEFAFPTGGFFLVAALVLFIAAVGVVLIWGTRTEAVVGVIGFCVGVPVVGWLMVRAWKSMALKSGLDPKRAGGTVAQSVPELSELDALRGLVGRTATPMRPAGVVLFDGRRIDALTEGVMLDAGVQVQCVGVKAGRVIVRKVNASAVLTDLTLDE